MIEVVSDPNELAKKAVEIFVASAREAIRTHDRFSVVLSGGSTPRKTYERIALSEDTRALPWKKIHFFWSDERMVPPDHPESNYRMAYEAMLSKLPIPRKNVHRIRAEFRNPLLVTAQYSKDLVEFFGLGSSPKAPGPDLGFLGLGEDGHTASLFPDGRTSGPLNRWVIAPWVDHLRTHRISMSLEMLNLCKKNVFLVTGEVKAEALKQVLEERRPLPAHEVRSLSGDPIWLLDRAAASRLSPGTIHQAA